MTTDEQYEAMAEAEQQRLILQAMKADYKRGGNKGSHGMRDLRGSIAILRGELRRSEAEVKRSKDLSTLAIG